MRGERSGAQSNAAAELSLLVMGVIFAAIVAVCTTPWFRSNVHTNDELMARSRIATAICSARSSLTGEDFMDCHDRVSNRPLWAEEIK